MATNPSHNSRYPKQITYAEKYVDARFEYRHVLLPRDVYERIRHICGKRLLAELEWRELGVQQSRGWQHFMWHRPEPHILLFRRPIGTDPVTGEVDDELARQARNEYQKVCDEYQFKG